MRDVIQAMYDLLVDKDKWTKEVLARTAHGLTVPPAKSRSDLLVHPGDFVQGYRESEYLEFA